MPSRRLGTISSLILFGMAFEVFAAVKMWIVVLWFVMPCGFEEVTKVCEERVFSIARNLGTMHSSKKLITTNKSTRC